MVLEVPPMIVEGVVEEAVEVTDVIQAVEVMEVTDVVVAAVTVIFRPRVVWWRK